jgi:uncharacterized protein (TIGR03435 family)
MRPLVGIAFAFWFCGAACAQQFGIADVHVRPPNAIQAMRSGFSQGRYELRNATMVDLIRTAWGVDADKVFGGPAWLEIDRFDVVATAPAGSTAANLSAMLRKLLAERFHLVAHADSRDLPAYVLTATRKPQLTAADGSEESGCKSPPAKVPPPPRNVPADPVMVSCRNVTLTWFVARLPNLRGAAGYLFNYPVVDRTGIDGAWNFDLKWSPATGPAPAEPITLFAAVEKQLGLKLELSRIPTPVVVVDSVNRKPSDNPPGVAAALPPPPTKFEVAEIKLADPEDRELGSHVGIQRGGQTLIKMTLKGLIQEAWSDMDPDRIVGGPKSIDSTRFVVVAKAPAAELQAGPGVFNGIDVDGMRAMLRNLLIERFHLETHEETRPLPGYALLAARPKLRPADPANRPGCKEGPGPDGKDPRTLNPLLARLVTCRNMTLAQFAAELGNIAEDYLHSFPPVVEATGIEGSYDLTLNFSPVGLLPRQGDPSDPNGAISLFEALDRQLGLKLESRKVPGAVLVIDHVDEK